MQGVLHKINFLKLSMLLPKLSNNFPFGKQMPVTVVLALTNGVDIETMSENGVQNWHQNVNHTSKTMLKLSLDTSLSTPPRKTKVLCAGQSRGNSRLLWKTKDSGQRIEKTIKTWKTNVSRRCNNHRPQPTHENVAVTKWIKSCLLPCFDTFKMPFLMFISILVFRPEGQIWNPVRRDTKTYVQRLLNASRISKTLSNSSTISPS